MGLYDEISAEDAGISQNDLPEEYEVIQKESHRAYLAKASLIVLLGTLTSRIFGFFREVVMAAYFGNGMAADAYQVAYAIPNLFLQLFGSAAIGSAFIPVIVKYLTDKDYENVDILASSVANFLTLLFIFFLVIGLIFAPFLTKLIAPGFVADVSKFQLTVFMTRIMFPCVLFLGLAGFVMGMLHSYNHFTAPAFAPISFNIFIISSIILLTRIVGPISLAIGVSLGALSQFLVQLPFLKKKVWRYSLTFAWKHPGVRQVAMLILPVVFSLASIEINVFVDTRFASLLPAGSVAALHYALRLWYLPIGLFAVTISTVLFPTFSHYAALNDLQGLKETYSFGMRMVFLVMIPASVILIVLATPIVKLVFLRGAFDEKAAYATSSALLFYTLGLTSASLLHLTNRVFYSIKDTLTPTIVTIIAIIVNYFGDWILSGPLKQGGIALSTSIVMTFNFICLLVILRKKIGQMGGRIIVKSFIKISCASCIPGLGAFFGWRCLSGILGESAIGQLLSVGTGIGIGMTGYILSVRVLKIKEASFLSGMVAARFKKIRRG